MRNQIYLAFILCLVVSSTISAQIVVNQDTLEGNEWIDYNRSYYKMMLAEDGLYRVTYQELIDAGVPLSNVQGSELQVYYFGEEQKITVSTEGQLGENDYIQFIGKKNRGELDKHLYADESYQLNPEYSLYSDTSAYFLAWEQGVQGQRYETQIMDINSNSLPPEPYYIAEDINVYTTWHNKPSEASSVRYSQYIDGEGYSGVLRQTNTLNHKTSDRYQGGPDPILNIRMSGNNLIHKTSISIDNEVIIDAMSIEGETMDHTSTFSSSLLENNMSVVVRNTNSSEDRNTVAISKIRYPRNFNFNNESKFNFTLESSGSTRYIEINNFNANEGDDVYLYDLTNHNRYQPVVEGGLVKLLLPSSLEDTDFSLVNESIDIKAVSDISPAYMNNYNEIDDAEYIIISTRVFNKAHNDGVNYLEAYADHRSSENGGGFSTAIVFVEDLYDQFAYGINRHTLSIKNFNRWISQNWPSAKFYFLIGKGIEYPAVRTEEQLTSEDPLMLKTYVPTFGIPGSDNSLMAKKNHSQPIQPTGRISVTRLDQLKSYYNKVTLRENPDNYDQTIEGKHWTKNVIHLAGGSADIQSLISSSLVNMGNILSMNRFGANVIQFEKFSSDNIQDNFTTEILNTINEGAAILSFFGHSSAGTFDLSLEKAKEYGNKGKLPVFLSMGCYSGNIYVPSYSISEDFVLEDEVGSIAFMASSGSAYISPQGALGQRFYTELGDSYYHKSVGELVHFLLEQNDTLQNNSSLRTLNEQFTLHGDPAVKIFAHDGPDYTINYASVNTEPNIISPDNKEFTLNFEIVNLGEAINDSIDVRIIHQLPDGTPFDTIYTKYKAPENRFMAAITLKNPELDGVGKNCIKIDIDYNNKIQEGPLPFAESNNDLLAGDGTDVYCFFILDNSANPIYPEEFAIVNGDIPRLVASTSNILAENRNYLMQVDTTTNFNSDLLDTKLLTDAGGSLLWEPSIDFVPGTVYYWRVSPDSTDVNIGYQWKESSFIYLPNSSDGWNQSHYYQYLRNDLDGIEFEDRNLDFLNEPVSLFLNVKVDDFQNKPRFFLNGNTEAFLRMWDFPETGLGIVRLDEERSDFIINQSPGLHGSRWLNNGQHRMFFYPTNTQTSRIDFVNHLQDIVEDGEKVFVFTVTNDVTSDLNIDDWALDSLANNNRNIFNTLEGFGATMVRQFLEKGTVPYAFVFDTKNGPIDENMTNDILEVGSVTGEFSRDYIEGDLTTPLIGPALSWNKLLWRVVDEEPLDEYMLYINGIKENGDMDTLYTVVGENEVDLSMVDASIYPHLKLDMYMVDTINQTPVNLDYWRILFEAAPEAILVKDESYVFNNDTLQQGQTLQFAIRAENISSTDMDSLLVKYIITNDANVEVVSYDRMMPLAGNSDISLAFDYDTKDLSGLHQFNFEINPENDQVEKFTFNNFGIREFYVTQDTKDPVMDVSFDGVHIINGDLVSANPYILIDIKDENEYLLLDDPEAYQIALIQPDGTRIDYEMTDPDITFEPATNTDNNRSKISLEPELVQDGRYTLIVQSTDATGNFSGVNAYSIDFEVVVKESVSQMLNYPNPFSTQTQFVFTLTGSEVPDDMSISILTVSGKVVKEISRDDLGPIRIGHNRTEYKWDGTDDYGQKLANGVYLYKVNLPVDMDRYETAADKFFTKGFGKMVIMR